MSARILSGLALVAAALALALTVLPEDEPTASAAIEDDAFGERVRAYLVENPQVLTEVVAALESQEAAQQAAAEGEALARLSDELFSDPADWVGGNPDGDVVIVEFLDYRCGFCRRAHPELDALMSQDTNIKFVIKEFPILGEESVIASRFALSARYALGDDAYKAVHDALMAHSGPMSQGALGRMARDIGLDPNPILQGMEDERITETLLANRALAQALQINGTPAFALKDRVLRGYLPLDGMQAVVDEVRGG